MGQNLTHLRKVCFDRLFDINNTNLSLMNGWNNLRSFKFVEVRNFTEEHWNQICTLEQISMLYMEIKSQRKLDVASSRSTLNKIMEVVSRLNNLKKFTFVGKCNFEINEEFFKEFISKRLNVTLILNTNDDKFEINHFGVKKNDTCIMVNSIECNQAMYLSPNGIEPMDDTIDTYNL